MAGTPESVEQEVQIVNSQGLHARPVMRFVDIANAHDATVNVRKNECQVDGKSPMEMMLLEAPQGTKLHISAVGPDAAAVVEALVELVAGGFGEE